MEFASCPGYCPCPCTPETAHCIHPKPCYHGWNEKKPRRHSSISEENCVGHIQTSIEAPSTNQYHFVAETALPTTKGTLSISSFSPNNEPYKSYLEPLVISSGDLTSMDSVPVRVHDQCFTSEVLGSLKCDCKQQLDFAINYIKQNGGLVIYLQQEGRGIGLSNKIAAYHLQESGVDTVDANRQLGLPDDLRDYHCVVDILHAFGIKKIRLMTNNPKKIKDLEALGIIIESRIPVITPTNPYSINYLHTKARRMGHYLPLDGIPNIQQQDIQTSL
ncbi:hypothetical protein WA158_008259 [Blastocystis sp. Blastoise]